MKSIRLLAVCFGMLFLVLSSVARAQPLLIAVEDDAAPWSKPDGTGYANDVVRAAFEAAGVEVSLVRVPYARCKFMVMNGQAVGCFSMAWESGLTGKVRFSSKPLFSSQVNFYVNAKKRVVARKLSDIPQGTVIGVVNAFEYPAQVQQLQQRGVAVFEGARSDETNLKKLALGRIGMALLVNLHPINPDELVLAKAHVTGAVKLAFHAGVQDAYLGFSRLHPDGEAARKAFDRGYELIAGDGRLAQIDQKWRRLAQEALQALSK